MITKTLLLIVYENRERMLILGKPLYSRAPSKSDEMLVYCIVSLALVHNYTTVNFPRSFRMLNLGWSDGNTFLSLAFSLLSFENKKNRF